MKAALLKLSVKEPNLDCNILSNYTFVLNLSLKHNSLLLNVVTGLKQLCPWWRMTSCWLIEVKQYTLKTPCLQTGESSISPTDFSWNLWVILDKFINMNDHVNSVYMSKDALNKVVHAFVTSSPDYHNSLLYGGADYNINSL